MPKRSSLLSKISKLRRNQHKLAAKLFEKNLQDGVPEVVALQLFLHMTHMAPARTVADPTGKIIVVCATLRVDRITYETLRKHGYHVLRAVPFTVVYKNASKEEAVREAEALLDALRKKAAERGGT
ncbi:MAG: hypothetical protein ABGW50_02005 [Thermococcus sp.]